MENLTFPNILAVADYLKTRGWKIQKSSAYEHARQGKIRPQSDGTFNVKAVEKYARTFLKRYDGQKISGRLEGIQEERFQSETRKAKAQAEYCEMKTNILAGSYVEREAFEHALAQRAAIFRNDIETFFRGSASDIIHMVGGNPGKIPDLIKFMLENANDWLSRYAAEGEIRPMKSFPEIPGPGTDEADKQDEDIDPDGDE